LKPLISNGSKIASMLTELISDNVVITHPDEIANAFNTFFANIGHTTSESVTPPPEKLFPLSQSGFPMPENFLYGTCLLIGTHKYMQLSKPKLAWDIYSPFL